MFLRHHAIQLLAALTCLAISCSQTSDTNQTQDMTESWDLAETDGGVSDADMKDVESSETFCTRLRQAECDWWRACRGDEYGDLCEEGSDLFTEAKRFCAFTLACESISRVNFDPIGAAACVEALSVNPDCSTRRPEVELRCTDAFTGTLGEGEICNASLECQSGSCRRAETNAYNVCFLLRPREPATPLPSDSATGCGSSLDCLDDGNCVDGACTRALPADVGGQGERCFRQRCRDGFWCRSQNFGTQVCVPLGESGDSCSSMTCGPGLVCDQGTCFSQRELGQSCDPRARTPLCAPGLFCSEEEICQPLLELGASCEDDQQCRDSQCWREVCRNPLLTCEPLYF